MQREYETLLNQHNGNLRQLLGLLTTTCEDYIQSNAGNINCSEFSGSEFGIGGKCFTAAVEENYNKYPRTFTILIPKTRYTNINSTIASPTTIKFTGIFVKIFDMSKNLNANIKRTSIKKNLMASPQ